MRKFCFNSQFVKGTRFLPILNFDNTTLFGPDFVVSLGRAQAEPMVGQHSRLNTQDTYCVTTQ